MHPEGAPHVKNYWEFVRSCQDVMQATPSIRRRLQDHGVNLIPVHFYSGIPSLEELESLPAPEVGQPPYADPTVFVPHRLASMLSRLAAFAHEFDPPKSGQAQSGFYWENPMFSGLDAMSYYCMLRETKPEVVLEIGGGYSTLIAQQALDKNGHGQILVVDPFPASFLANLPRVKRIVSKRVQDVPFDELMALVNHSDVVFIDSTHTVKLGSDCLLLYLRVLPAAQRRILVHSHDIYLPWDFPAKKAAEDHQYWTEQYLLHGWLLDNPRTNVVFGAQWHATFNPREAREFMGGKAAPHGGSLWFTVDPRQSTK